MEKEKINTLTLALFSIYLLVLVWSILFKFHFSFSDIHADRAINLIPFHGSVANSGLSAMEIFVNILLFIPFGIYISMLIINRSVLTKIFVIFGTSLVFETLQFIFSMGRSDITDLVNNTFGGMLGIVIYMFLYKLLKRRTIKVINIISLLAIILVPLLIAGYLRITGIRIRL